MISLNAFAWEPLFTVLIAAWALRHDTWLWPAEWGEAEGVCELRTGHQFPVSDTATKPSRLASSHGFGPETEWSQKEAALVAQGEAVGSILAVALHPHLIVMQAPEFMAYLREEALGDFELETPQREIYTKQAKCILDAHHPAARVPVGHSLEFVVDDEGLCPLLHGSPWTDALLKLYSEDGVAFTVSGTAPWECLVEGTWMARAHYLVGLNADDHEWESLWASLTIRVEASGSR